MEKERKMKRKCKKQKVDWKHLVGTVCIAIGCGIVIGLVVMAIYFR